MDWSALWLSLRLAFWTCAILLPAAVVIARWLVFRRPPGRHVIEALIALPLVLPPTVLGYYLLVSMGRATPLGELYESLTGRTLVFSFDGLVVASILFNLPFAIQPLQRAFEGVPQGVREAAWVSGLSPLATLFRIELPLVWPGVLSALALTFAHTLGEFGVVLMVGGSIPGETKTIAISIYDRVQAFDEASAAAMAAFLLVASFAAIALVLFASDRTRRRG
jgi:molybdate transport system permease protein